MHDLNARERRRLMAEDAVVVMVDAHHLAGDELFSEEEGDAGEAWVTGIKCRDQSSSVRIEYRIEPDVAAVYEVLACPEKKDS